MSPSYNIPCNVWVPYWHEHLGTSAHPNFFTWRLAHITWGHEFWSFDHPPESDPSPPLLASYVALNKGLHITFCLIFSPVKWDHWDLTERVTGRKARGLQTEEIGCKCQTFLSLLSARRKQASDIFSFSIQIQKEVSLKILCYHNDTWFHLKLTILKPWVNQCVFLMEMFVLS